jgi:hypothetical protein
MTVLWRFVSDLIGCQASLFEWAESYDTKDWDRLAKCIAPTLRVCSTFADSVPAAM